MLRFGLFKQPKARQFRLPHRYYDERKERLEKLKAKFEAPAGDDEFDPKLYREHLRSAWSHKRHTNTSGGNSSMRVIVIALVLAGLIYWIFN